MLLTLLLYHCLFPLFLSRLFILLFIPITMTALIAPEASCFLPNDFFPFILVANILGFLIFESNALLANIICHLIVGVVLLLVHYFVDWAWEEHFLS